MVGRYENDLIDGREVPPLVVTSGYVLTGIHDGTIQVEAGLLEVEGTLRGTLNVYPGAFARMRGRQQRTVHVASRPELAAGGAEC